MLLNFFLTYSVPLKKTKIIPPDNLIVTMPFSTRRQKMALLLVVTFPESQQRLSVLRY